MTTNSSDSAEDDRAAVTPRVQPAPQDAGSGVPREVGGREGPEPTRFGDWELRGRCIDF